MKPTIEKIYFSQCINIMLQPMVPQNNPNTRPFNWFCNNITNPKQTVYPPAFAFLIEARNKG